MSYRYRRGSKKSRRKSSYTRKGSRKSSHKSRSASYRRKRISRNTYDYNDYRKEPEYKPPKPAKELHVNNKESIFRRLINHFNKPGEKIDIVIENPKMPIEPKESFTCCICYEEITNKIALVPCGHTKYCSNCVEKIVVCSLCKKEIEKVINIYE